MRRSEAPPPRAPSNQANRRGPHQPAARGVAPQKKPSAPGAGGKKAPSSAKHGGDGGGDAKVCFCYDDEIAETRRSLVGYAA